MNKTAFYPKLALNSLWRNRKTYFPYLLACSVSVFTFYTLVSITMNGSLEGLPGAYVVITFTSIGSVIMALFCGGLIFYTNSFLVKRRKKELGLYIVLGMEKRNIAVLMFYETLFISGIALAAGIGLGLLLGRLIFWVMLKMVRFPVMMGLNISGTAILITIAFFGAVFFLTLLTNLRQVSIVSPAALISGARQGEKEPKAGKLTTVTGLLCLGGGYFLALYFTSPTEALMMFLVAVILVIAGTYCLFTSGSVAVLKMLRRNKKYYYQPGHFISVSGMIYRMKQNAAGLSAICILSCMVLVTVSSTVSLNVGAEESLSFRYPYDIEIDFHVYSDGDAFKAKALALADEEGLSLTNAQDYISATFMASEEDGVFINEAVSGFGSVGQINIFTLMTLEDYNLNNNDKKDLSEGEALLMVTGGSYKPDTITLNGMTYKIRPLESMGKAKAGQVNLGRGFVIVLPGQSDIDLIAAGYNSETVRNVAFDIEGSEFEKARFTALYREFADNTAQTSGEFNYSAKQENEEDWYANNGGFLFLGVYFGILFMLAATLIIYYKQLSEGYDDAQRFEILQKVGMSETEVKRTINKQIMAVFFLPLLAAAVHITVAFFPVSRVMIIFGVYNMSLMAWTTAFTVLAYALAYLFVFLRTAKAYFGIVKREAV